MTQVVLMDRKLYPMKKTNLKEATMDEGSALINNVQGKAFLVEIRIHSSNKQQKEDTQDSIDTSIRYTILVKGNKIMSNR